MPSSSGRTGRPAYSSVSPRAMIQFSRSGASPRRTSVSTDGSVYGPEVSYSVTSTPVGEVHLADRHPQVRP